MSPLWPLLRSTDGVQPIDQRNDQVMVAKFVPPRLRYSVDAVISTRKLAKHGTGGVCVVTEIHCQQATFLERVAAGERPQCGLQRLDGVAGAFDLWWYTIPVRTACYFVDFGA